jgi:small-conductance mechanosensitive channel
LLDSAIKIDDVLEFDGMVCKVSKIGVRTSTVINRDDVYIIVPNSKFTSDKVINWTHSGQLARFHIHVSVAYNSDIDLVKRCLLESAASEDEICKTPEPMVSLKSFDDSGISFGLYFWSHEIFRVERICSDLRTKILLQFRKNGIEIPYPKMDVNIKENHLPT